MRNSGSTVLAVLLGLCLGLSGCPVTPGDDDDASDDDDSVADDDDAMPDDDDSASDPCEEDADGDGVPLCGPDGVPYTADDDCDDGDPDVFPGNPEVCDDGKDNDCQGGADCDDDVCVDELVCHVGSTCYEGTDTTALPSDVASGALDIDDQDEGPRGPGHFFDDIEIVLEAGQILFAEITYADFDTYLYLLDDDCAELAFDDDGGVELLSRLTFEAPETAVYTIVVTSYDPGIEGSYTLLVDQEEGDCFDGVDDDGDGVIDCEDPGCYAPCNGGHCYTTDFTLQWPSAAGAGELYSWEPDTGGPLGGSRHFEDWEFFAEAGHRVVLEADSPDFHIWLHLMDSTCTNPVGVGDAAPWTGGAQVDVIIPADGLYTAVVTTDLEGETGEYTLTLGDGEVCGDGFDNDGDGDVDCLDAGCEALYPCVPGLVCYGDEVTLSLPSSEESGSLGFGDEVWPDPPNNFFDDVEFMAYEGQLIALEVTSAAFDTFLYLQDNTCTTVASDDNSGLDDLSGLVYEVPATGVYIAAVTIAAGETVAGNYTLRLDEAEADCDDGVDSDADGLVDCDDPGCLLQPECVPGEVCYSDVSTLTGPYDINAAQNLNSNDLTDGPAGNGPYYDDIEFLGFAGDQVTIEMTESVFDTYLYLLDDTCSVLVEDDDSAGGNLSRIDYTIPTTGIYTIVVTTQSAGVVGSYTIEFTVN